VRTPVAFLLRQGQCVNLCQFELSANL
jgi:hypothetical protein